MHSSKWPAGLCPLQAKVPGAKKGGEPLPEGMLWLLLTGDVSPFPAPGTCRLAGLSWPPLHTQACTHASTLSPPVPLPSPPPLPQVPTADQVRSVTALLQERSALPAHVTQVLAALPEGTHPMVQLSQAVLSLQVGSKFSAAYNAGVHKSKCVAPRYVALHGVGRAVECCCCCCCGC